MGVLKAILCLVTEFLGTRPAPAKFYANKSRGKKTAPIFANESGVPLSVPAPFIIFRSGIFVLTGNFTFGSKTECSNAIKERGGSCEENVTARTNYVVVGSLGSGEYKYQTYGTKIDRAIELATEESGVSIVSEERWLECMKRAKR